MHQSETVASDPCALVSTERSCLLYISLNLALKNVSKSIPLKFRRIDFVSETAWRTSLFAPQVNINPASFNSKTSSPQYMALKSLYLVDEDASIGDGGFRSML
ncbi:hypothetical protein AVEN_213003-1 [Araneus ventricosus]|uniref:Uncharacterized protein n=1 Tax=Araneus ventricosus TaxID=182803 RepID=A0A4Y2JVG6_ARAVE|nr:hypothetical protein AVEN_213003-1 [Araneus ventricosus]